MQKAIITACLSTLLASPAFANTEHESQQSNGKFSAGVGSYALVVEADGYSEDQFAGFSVFGDYAFNDHFSLRGQYYSVEHDDFSELEASGLEANAYFGTGLASNGFKAFIGGGFYSEEMEADGFDENFFGAQISGGIGYNWQKVSLDFTLAIRTAGDYADMLDEDEDDVVAASGSLNIAYRF